jgi:hypothetical protein
VIAGFRQSTSDESGHRSRGDPGEEQSKHKIRAVGRRIYCFASNCDLGDEHITPQALGGNIILQGACSSACEKIIGAGLEHRLMHKTKGMFAALRLRHGYKSKRPKERPKSLPFTIIGKDGSSRIVNIPANKVPRYWVTYVTLTSPGVIIGLPPNALGRGSVITQFNQDDIKALADRLRPGDSIQKKGLETVAISRG